MTMIERSERKEEEQMKKQKEYLNNKKNVGGGIFDTPLLYRNTQKGITLIALIITIIVLLILAMVSIKLIWDGGIIAHSKNAVGKYSQAQQNEIEQLNNIFGKNENQNNVPEELQKYVLGENLEGQDLSNIYAAKKFKGQLNGETIQYVTAAYYFYTKDEEETYDRAIYAKYQNKIYRILVEENNKKTKEVAFIYAPTGREGQKVEYSCCDGVEGVEGLDEEWTILYDNGDNVEIISPEAMGRLTLGYEDTEATGNNDFEKAVNSYNNAIDRLNTYARELVENTNKIAVRSVGSNPNDSDSRNTNKYTSDRLESWNCSYNGSTVTINGVGERSDNNYEQDFVRMSYWGIARTGRTYWLASRCIQSDSDDIRVNVATVATAGGYMRGDLWYASSNGSARVSSANRTLEVRPVVKVDASRVKIK